MGLTDMREQMVAYVAEGEAGSPDTGSGSRKVRLRYTSTIPEVSEAQKGSPIEHSLK
jgi:hypothetical protein